MPKHTVMIKGSASLFEWAKNNNNIMTALSKISGTKYDLLAKEIIESII